MTVKKELIIYIDVGIVGTFVAWEKHSSDENYRYLLYVPLDSRLKKVIKYEKPIHVSAIHNVDPILQIKGVPDRMVYIFTGEEGSIAKKVMDTNYINEINELRAKNKSLEMKNASLTQEVENARAGVSKAIAGVRGLTKKSDGESQSSSGNIFDRFKNREQNNELSFDD